MKIHYYLGWFDNFFPEKLGKVLQTDISNRKSLVMISSNPSSLEADGATERSWLHQAGIVFDEDHVINYHISREDAQRLIRNASVIFLLGGDTIKLNTFLDEYELAKPIKQSRAVILGASAGAINMSAKWICSKNFGYDVERSTIYDGIGLDDFAVLSHFNLENDLSMVHNELSSLSEEVTIYASNKDCAVRVKGGNIDIVGDVYLISHTKMQKLEETL